MYQNLQYIHKDLEVVKTPIVGFRGQAMYSLGSKRLLVWVGDKQNSQTLEANFLVVDISMPYNVILGCPTLIAIKAIVASYL